MPGNRLLALATLAVGALAVVSIAAWAVSGERCEEGPLYATPREALEHADFVYAARTTGAVGRTSYGGRTANVHDIATSDMQLLKGDAVGWSPLEVISAPALCGAVAYPEGDPLDSDRPLVLFLVRDGDQVRTLSLDHGSLQVRDVRGNWPLPDAWPAR